MQLEVSDATITKLRLVKLPPELFNQLLKTKIIQ